MARQTLTVQDFNAQFSTTGKVLTLTSSNATDKEQAIIGNGIFIVAWNSGASSRTVTVNSVALNNRTGDITAQALAADEIALFGPFKGPGYAQTGGYLFWEASHADVKVAAVRLPNV